MTLPKQVVTKGLHADQREYQRGIEITRLDSCHVANGSSSSPAIPDSDLAGAVRGHPDLLPREHHPPIPTARLVEATHHPDTDSHISVQSPGRHGSARGRSQSPTGRNKGKGTGKGKTGKPPPTGTAPNGDKGRSSCFKYSHSSCQHGPKCE